MLREHVGRIILACHLAQLHCTCPDLFLYPQVCTVEVADDGKGMVLCSHSARPPREFPLERRRLSMHACCKVMPIICSATFLQAIIFFQGEGSSEREVVPGLEYVF